MSPQDRCGIKLIDVVFAILVIGILVGLLLPSPPHAYERGPRAQCANNMRQIGLALINFSTSKNRFPNAGTFRDDPTVHGGDPEKSTIYQTIRDPGMLPDGGASWLHSWVVDVLPYLDQQDLADAWDATHPYWWPTRSAVSQISNRRIASTELRILRCPDDSDATWGQGNLSYVVNGGFTRWPAIPIGWVGGPTDGEPGNGEVLQWTPPGRPWQETQAIGKQLGVMFLGTESGDQPWDITTAPAEISDGQSETLLVAENRLAGYSEGTTYSNGWATNWACPLPNFVMFLGSDDVCGSPRSPNDCLGGQLAPRPNGADGPGWARANQTGTHENINYGQNLSVKGSFPFATSAHRGGSFFTFCDGAVRFLSESIDGTVYAKLITPAGGRLPRAMTQSSSKVSYKSPSD